MNTIDDDFKDGFAPGPNKKDNTHDHRSNKGGHRTPAQKAGDKKRRK